MKVSWKSPKRTVACFRAAFLFLFFLSLRIDAMAGNLLIERNARPLLAEGSLEALGPWETPLDGFFVRSHHNVFPVEVDDSWQVLFEGLLSKPKKISIRELKKLKQVSFHAVLECSGNGRGLFTPQVSGIQWKRGAVGNAEWTGVRFEDAIKELGVKAEANFVTVEGFDEPVMKADENSATKFIRSIPLKLLIDTKSILAFKMNRQGIPVAHGGPVRLVMPGIYGQNWIKWVNKMTFSKDVDPRMYAKKAYRMPDKTVKPGEAWDPVKQGKPVEYIRVQTIFTSPAPAAKVAPGKMVLRGKAFSGTGAIAKVEISLDEGRSWDTAKLSQAKDYAWQEFEREIEVQDGKAYVAWARATDSNGNVQPVEQEWNPKGYLFNAVDRVRFSGDIAGSILAEGERLAGVHCLTCHSIGIAEGQRLDKNDWKKTVKKMADYGLVLPDPDAEKIANYFANRFPPGSPSDDSRQVELAADPSALVSPGVSSLLRTGDVARGQKLFAVHCAACHGDKGEGRAGMLGPVLKGRALTDATFWSTVMQGRVRGESMMPPFKDVLNGSQIVDIRAWIQRPVKK